jgi:hypothetical protein
MIEPSTTPGGGPANRERRSRHNLHIRRRLHLLHNSALLFPLSRHRGLRSFHRSSGISEHANLMKPLSVTDSVKYFGPVDTETYVPLSAEFPSNTGVPWYQQSCRRNHVVA